jgi:OOP family OmpA-OmpF porin
VYFDQSSYLLRPESYTQLNQLVALLKSRPGLKIEISGHTDNVGDPRLNLALSENRARVITSYLITNGITENRLRFKGYGQTQPIAANDTEENKRKNRRVEVRLLDG